MGVGFIKDAKRMGRSIKDVSFPSMINHRVLQLTFASLCVAARIQYINDDTCDVSTCLRCELKKYKIK